MATKDPELIQAIDDELKLVDGALIQIRAVQKALEGSRDTLRYIKNVIAQRKGEVPAEAQATATRDSWRAARS